MAQERPHRARLLKALGIVLGLALVALGCVQSVHLAQSLMQGLRPASFEAPPACAHDTPNANSAATPPQESLVVAVNSYRSAGHGFGARVATNAALCIIRTDDGAIVRHFALDGHANVWNLTRADGVIYFRSQLSPDQDVQVCAMRASDGTKLWCQVNRIAVSTVILARMPHIVSDGTLYIQDLTRIVAVRASDGTTLWKHAIDPRDQNFRGIAAANESVYVHQSMSQFRGAARCAHCVPPMGRLAGARSSTHSQASPSSW
jgi:PQQ-like domain